MKKTFEILEKKLDANFDFNFFQLAETLATNSKSFCPQKYLHLK